MTNTPTPEPTPQPTVTVPVAIVSTVPTGADTKRGSLLGTRLWIVTALCFVMAIGLTLWSQKRTGPTISIQFEDGFGIRPGNTLQHRGIEVGEVTSVLLQQSGNGVDVKVSLHPQAKSLAREGSQFWIVRPRLSLTRMSGLETVVGAKYIAVQPGPENGKQKQDFVGLETPLMLIDSEALELTVSFREGHGLMVGDPVKHRGIAIGEVADVDLTDDLGSVRVRLRLAGAASKIARAGTQFWVERPTINIAEIRGLDTLVAGRHVALQPGPKDAAMQTEFAGLDQPPPANVPEDGLEIVLEASRRGGLQRGVPVLYRGIRVGHVMSVGLASDNASVVARAWIESDHQHLIRSDSKFWMNDGFDVSVGLKGVKLSTETLSTILLGGVSFATPTSPGEAARTGQRFTCDAKPEDEWLNWQPRLLPTSQQAAGVELPHPVRASLRWKEKVLGFNRARQRGGWILCLQNGRVLGPTNLLVDQAASASTASLEAGGAILVRDPEPRVMGPLTIARIKTMPAGLPQGWPTAKLRVASKPEDCVIVAAPDQTSLFVPESRLVASSGRWTVDPAIPLNADHHGAVVVARADGAVLGLVTIDETRPSIALLTE